MQLDISDTNFYTILLFQVVMSSELIEEHDFHMDHLDLEILKILANNCRTSYRSVGLALGLTTNTVKRRVKLLIQNKII